MAGGCPVNHDSGFSVFHLRGLTAEKEATKKETLLPCSEQVKARAGALFIASGLETGS